MQPLERGGSPSSVSLDESVKVTKENTRSIETTSRSSANTHFSVVAMTTRVTCKLKLHVLLPWECALQNGTRIQIVQSHMYIGCVTRDPPMHLNHVSHSACKLLTLLSPSLLKSEGTVFANSDARLKKGIKVTSAQPYFAALDSVAAV